MRDDDVSAFETLFDALFPAVARLAFQYVRSSDVADDIAQDAFVTLWNERRTWTWDGSVLGFLQLLVRRRAIDWLRSDLAAAKRDAAWTADRPDARPPDADAHAALLRARIDDAIGHLPPRMRAVAVLRWVEGVTRDDAAQALGVSVRTIDAQLHAATKAIREALDPLREPGPARTR